MVATSAQRRAHMAVAKAIDAGHLPPLGQAVCLDCGAVADVYHHPRGYEGPSALDVEPLCYPCHGSRDHHHPASQRTKRLTIELEPEDEAIVHRAKVQAVMEGITLREYIIRALRAWLDRHDA